MGQESYSRTIEVHALARVEGEGGLTVRVRDGRVVGVELRIYEPPRFYEALLRGRHAAEVPDIVARICGICPVAYQMSAVHALEKIFGVAVSPQVRALRRLLYCGEWIESHTLHIFLLHAPDFLGFDSALSMAQANPDLAALVRRGLRMKKAGNRIMQVIGGREIHPVNVQIGGFYRAPRREELLPLLDELRWGRDAAVETVRWAAALPAPPWTGGYEFVALRHPSEYAMNEGRLGSSAGLDVAQEEFLDHFEEYQVPHSHALHARRRGNGTGSYSVGALARWHLNYDRAPHWIQHLAHECGFSVPVHNPYRSIVARSLEVLLAFDEAIALIENYEPPSPARAPVTYAAGIGQAITEAPRGILYHRYETDAAGIVRWARIVPPTSQNQAQMEHDLWTVAPRLVSLPEPVAALEAEKVIRNYDPCISCATHFLRLRIEQQ